MRLSSSGSIYYNQRVLSCHLTPAQRSLNPNSKSIPPITLLVLLICLPKAILLRNTFYSMPVELGHQQHCPPHTYHSLS